MRKKTIPSGKNPTKLDASLIPKECNDKGDIRATKGKFCQDTQGRRMVKLPPPEVRGSRNSGHRRQRA